MGAEANLQGVGCVCGSYMLSTVYVFMGQSSWWRQGVNLHKGAEIFKCDIMTSLSLSLSLSLSGTFLERPDQNMSVFTGGISQLSVNWDEKLPLAWARRPPLDASS